MKSTAMRVVGAYDLIAEIKAGLAALETAGTGQRCLIQVRLLTTRLRVRYTIGLCEVSHYFAMLPIRTQIFRLELRVLFKEFGVGQVIGLCFHANPRQAYHNLLLNTPLRESFDQSIHQGQRRCHSRHSATTRAAWQGADVGGQGR